MVLSQIDMNQPWIYMYSPSRSPLPPPSPPDSSVSPQCTRSDRLSHASSLGWWSVSPWIIYMFRCCCCCLGTKLSPTLLKASGLYPARLLCPWDFPGNNTGVGCHFLLQHIFPTQGLNPGLLHCRQILYHWGIWETHAGMLKFLFSFTQDEPGFAQDLELCKDGVFLLSIG